MHQLSFIQRRPFLSGCSLFVPILILLAIDHTGHSVIIYIMVVVGIIGTLMAISLMRSSSPLSLPRSSPSSMIPMLPSRAQSLASRSGSAVPVSVVEQKVLAIFTSGSARLPEGALCTRTLTLEDPQEDDTTRSYVQTVLFEEVASHGRMPVCIFTTKNSYADLVAAHPNSLLLGHPQTVFDLPEEARDRFYPVEKVETITQWIAYLFSPERSETVFVYLLSGYENERLAEMLLRKALNCLFAHMHDHVHQVPPRRCLVVLPEARQFLPRDSHLGIELFTSVERATQIRKALMTILEKGPKYRLYTHLITDELTSLDARALELVRLVLLNKVPWTHYGTEETLEPDEMTVVSQLIGLPAARIAKMLVKEQRAFLVDRQATDAQPSQTYVVRRARTPVRKDATFSWKKVQTVSLIDSYTYEAEPAPYHPLEDAILTLLSYLNVCYPGSVSVESLITPPAFLAPLLRTLQLAELIQKQGYLLDAKAATSILVEQFPKILPEEQRRRYLTAWQMIQQATPPVLALPSPDTSEEERTTQALSSPDEPVSLAENEEREQEPIPQPQAIGAYVGNGRNSSRSVLTPPHLAVNAPRSDQDTPRSSGSTQQQTFSPSSISSFWKLPETSLLKHVKETRNQHIEDDTALMARTIEETLRSFRVDAEVREGDISIGPTIIRFGIRPTGKPEMRQDPRTGRLVAARDADGNQIYETRTRVSRIMALQNDLALVLEARTIRMQAPVAGRPYVGVEIPNKNSQLVTLREVLESKEYFAAKARSLLSIGLGKDVAGQVRFGDLAHMPHLLIAGATGSGKSVCINTIIASILTQATPDDVRLLMIDPKMVELNIYNGIPHLLSPVVTEVEKVVPLLKNAISEMERRYRLFSQLNVRNLDGYRKLRLEKIAKGDTSLNNLPAIVIIIDELADLMMAAPEEVESMICRLAQLARATGIHLVVATQRPSVDVITGLIKANIPTRISFMVSSAVDSRTIIDMGGAEHLLGRGDMLYLPADVGQPERIQGAFLADEEADNLVKHWKQQVIEHAIAVGDAVPSQELSRTEPDWEIHDEPNEDVELEDDLLEKAEEVIREYGKASISLLQRRLRVGYSRAARLIDLLEERGSISRAESVGRARDVLEIENGSPLMQSRQSVITTEGSNKDAVLEEEEEEPDGYVEDHQETPPCCSLAFLNPPPFGEAKRQLENHRVFQAFRTKTIDSLPRSDRWSQTDWIRGCLIALFLFQRKEGSITLLCRVFPISQGTATNWLQDFTDSCPLLEKSNGGNKRRALREHPNEDLDPLLVFLRETVN